MSHCVAVRSCLKWWMSRINVRLFSEGLQYAIHAELWHTFLLVMNV
jgi:hypothetical protein